MNLLSADCPRCLAKNATLEIIHRTPERPKLLELFELLCICRVCFRGVIAVCNHVMEENTMREEFLYTEPKVMDIDVPAHIPPEVERTLKKGYEALRARDWETAAMLVGKSIDVATKFFAPDLATLTLFARIERLTSDGRLTRELGAWAHHVRLLRNDAMHDPLDTSEKDARDISHFTELTLNYLFTLPGMLVEFQGTTSP
ncbi:MAG: DUF4145 domain-containing protein [Rudaea sp.]|uniref:DUF4145 domain-containing protein n=1 Tax=unclassified Rudaea TaxID=2627037 RepID=UPI001484D66E|nr:MULTISPECIES: DUF4145 domain-containing protein [unclassified Rudaea]MBN8887545.1 DUF4145 domain-containing protein [Rudaea sp.]